MSTNKFDILLHFTKKQKLSYPFWNSILFGIRLELKELSKYLSEDERIYSIIPCRYKGKKALVAVTSYRVIALNRGLFGDLSKTVREDVYYSQSSGGSPSGLAIFSYTISIPGNKDWKVTNIWGGDIKLLDKSYNKARQDYERRLLNKNQSVQEEDNSELKRISHIRELYKSGKISKEDYLSLLSDI